MNEFIRKDLGLNCLTGKVKSWLLYSLIMKTSEQRIWPEKNIDLKGLFKGNRFNFLVLIFLAYCTGFKFAFSWLIFSFLPCFISCFSNSKFVSSIFHFLSTFLHCCFNFIFLFIALALNFLFLVFSFLSSCRFFLYLLIFCPFSFLFSYFLLLLLSQY